MSARRSWFPTPRLGREPALRWTERLGALTAAVGSVEYLRGASTLARGGLNDPHITLRSVPGRWGESLRAGLNQRTARRMHAGRLVAVATLMLPTGRRARLAANTYLATTTYLTLVLELRGADGSDEVAALVQSSMAVSRVRDDPVVADAALWFLSLQSALSYLAAGVAKAAGRTWTGGTALTRILRTQAYGHREVWQFLERHPRLAAGLTRGVVVAELLAPVLLLRRERLAVPYVVTTSLFHVANAVVMGLGRFVFSFAGLYPAVLYVSTPADASMPGEARRTDRLPLQAGCVVAVLVLASMALSRRDQALLAQADDDLREHPTAIGGTLRYRVRGPAGGPAPLVVLESGTGSPPQTWHLVEERLEARAVPTLTYIRSTYPPSSPGPGGDTEPTFGRLVDELCGLVEALTTGPVVLVGHSFGGALAALAAQRLGDQVAALVLLDPSHPPEWFRFESTLAMGSRTLDITRRSLVLGLGAGLAVPDEYSFADPAVRPVLEAHYRAPSTWSTMRTEMELMRDVAEGDRAALTTSRPVTVLTARATAQVEPGQLEADARLAAGAGAKGRHEVVERCTHLGLLLAERPATQVADAILAAVARHTAAEALTADDGAHG